MLLVTFFNRSLCIKEINVYIFSESVKIDPEVLSMLIDKSVTRADTTDTTLKNDFPSNLSKVHIGLFMFCVFVFKDEIRLGNCLNIAPVSS